jgi:hypothetical protein
MISSMFFFLRAQKVGQRFCTAIAVVFLIFLSMSNTQAYADSYKTYSGTSAAAYAEDNYNVTYGSGIGENPFFDYETIGNYNCTNFASQAIIGGLINSTDPLTVYNNRKSFDVDKYGGVYRWYFWSAYDYGMAWNGAHALYNYAAGNLSTYKGLHFTFVTNDTPTTLMDYNSVQVGDIIFADWDNNDTMDHTMIVTRIDTWRTGYDKIRVTYQSPVNTPNRGLGDINIQYNYNAIFYVYRPLDYNPDGL